MTKTFFITIGSPGKGKRVVTRSTQYIVIKNKSSPPENQRLMYTGQLETFDSVSQGIPVHVVGGHKPTVAELR